MAAKSPVVATNDQMAGLRALAASRERGEADRARRTGRGEAGRARAILLTLAGRTGGEIGETFGRARGHGEAVAQRLHDAGTRIA